MKKLVFTLAAVLVASLAMAQTDFSGSWKLNASKSKVGEMSFAAKELTLVQKDNVLTVESVTSFQDQEMKNSEKYTLDGKESINTGMMDMQRKSTAVWSADKTTLTVTSKMDMQGQTMTTSETYKLNAGSLEVEFAISMPNMPEGGMKETRVYDKK